MIFRGNEDDWKRCSVCGVCWFENEMAVNLTQLLFLLKKCKSSVNTTMRNLGYTLKTPRADNNTHLRSFLSSLNIKTDEIRKWSIRNIPKLTQNSDENIEVKAKECACIDIENSSYYENIVESPYISPITEEIYPENAIKIAGQRNKLSNSNLLENDYHINIDIDTQLPGNT